MTARPSWAVGSDVERLVDTEAARLALGSVWWPDGPIGTFGGFRRTTGDPGKVTASTPTPDINVHVAAFQVVKPSSRGDGPYILTLDAAETLDVLGVDPADPANPRNDLVVVQQSDAFYGDADSQMRIRRVVGTPSATPVDPPVDGSPDFVSLARIRVGAGATAITDGDIDDLRSLRWGVAVGGILPVESAGEIGPELPGRYRHRLDTGVLEVDTGAAWVPFPAGDLTVPGDLTVGGAVDFASLGGSVSVQAQQDDTGTSSSTSFTTSLSGGTNPGTTFVAPPSGKIWIHWHASMVNNSAGGFCVTSFEVRTGAVVGSGVVVLAASDSRRIDNQGSNAGSDTAELGSSYLAEGLSAGVTHNIRQAFRVSGGTGTWSNKRIGVQPAI